MRVTAIHNELMRTRTLPIQCRANEVDSHSGNNINRAFDFYIISVLSEHTMMIIVFQIMAKPHTNCNTISDCYFLLINMSPINTKSLKKFEWRKVFSNTVYQLYPFNIFDNFYGGMMSHFLAVLCTYFNGKLGAMLLLRLPVPS